jgi:hypothetical protein
MAAAVESDWDRLLMGPDSSMVRKGDCV